MIIASFWIVIIIGLPLWWKTTEIYRAQLPFVEIEEWSRWEVFNIEFPTHFILYVANVEFDSTNFETLAKTIERSITLEYNSDDTIHNDYDDLNPPKSIRFPVKVELVIWNNWKNIYKEGFNYEMNSVSKNGQYSFYILPGNISKTKVLVRNQRQVIVETGQWMIDVIEKTVSNIILSLFLPEHAVIKKFIKESSTESKIEVDSMRTMKYSPMYQVTFSLMNGDPSSLLVDWDIEKAVNKYLKPFVDKISVISNLTMDSQIQHYARLTFEPQRNSDEGESCYSLTPELLPHFINAAEWNLASAVSSYPTLNFILYVPSGDQSPLYIKDSKENNAFLIPRWGGVMVSNPNRTSKTHTFTFDELNHVMSIFILQLRGLLGVQDFWNDARFDLDSSINVEFALSPNTAITTWELDSLVRRRIAENIVDTISTLKSLSQLVAEIPNMVVLDHIQTEVLLALNSLTKSCICLQDGEYDMALQHAKMAIGRAESAFFDPTMVSMLYFPNEHKYAIYMPLFVPISVPLIVALLRELKEFNHQRKKIKSHKESIQS